MGNNLNEWWKGMMLTCDDATRMSFDIPEGVKLSFSEKLKLKLHRTMCVWCRRYFKHTKFLRNAMKVQPEKSANGDISKKKMSDESKEKLKQLLQEKVEKS